jgi:tetratricopeptide (TPR) repeat protein
MSEEHLDLPTLRRFAAEELSGEELFDVGWHLFLCDECRDRLTEVGSDAEALYDRIFGGRGMSVPEVAYSEVTRAVADKLRHAGLEIERQRSRADQLWDELRAHPPSRRLLMVENASRFQTYALVELLLGECRRTWCDDPGHAEELAELALAVTYRLERRVHGPALLNDLKAEAWTYVANCRRIRADVRSVSEAFEIAESYRAGGTGDPLQEAEMLDLQATFLREQGRFGESSHTLERAILIYRAAGDSHAEGRTLIQQANVAWERGDEEAAIALLERAAGLVQPDRDPRLAFVLKHDLARFRGLAGRPEEAAALIPELRRLALEAGGRLDRLRLLWTEGLILARQGRVGVAEAMLRRAVVGFARSGAGYDAALAALDLAAVLLEAGQSGEARALAADLMPIFASRDIHREGLAALAIFQNAIERETATVTLVRELARYLRLARRNPALRFERLPGRTP